MDQEAPSDPQFFALPAARAMFFALCDNSLEKMESFQLHSEVDNLIDAMNSIGIGHPASPQNKTLFRTFTSNGCPKLCSGCGVRASPRVGLSGGLCN